MMIESEIEMSYEFTETYQRNDNDFYIEPRWCIEALIKAIKFEGQIHDPACGTGKIPLTFTAHGFTCTAHDLIDRGFGVSGIDYLKDTNIYDNIVTNPPYNKSELFIKRALYNVTGRVAILARIAFLASQKRYELFTDYITPEKVVILSRRPSMPPGGLGIIPQGGKTDFCWIVWNRNHIGPSEICWVL